MTKHRFVHPQRTNSGIILPELVIHAALSELPAKLKSGYYGKGNLEEPLVRVTPGMDQALIDDVFESLRKNPPTVGMEFPSDEQQLPAIFISTETMEATAPILADDAGSVAREVNTYEQETVLIEAAVGGETQFVIPCAGELISSMVDLVQIIGGQEIELFLNDDFSVDSASKRITLNSPLGAGDKLICTRYASWGLPGGDLYANTFSGTYIVFIDTRNPVTTSILKGIVWRELTLQTATLLSSGLVDLEYSVRYQSLWSEIQPAIGHRAELVVNCLTTWVAYKRLEEVDGISWSIRHNASEYNASPDDTVLELNTPFVRWPTDEEEAEEE